MKCVVHKSELNGTVFAPSSKSQTHRAYILAALSNGVSHIYNPLFADDTNATLRAIQKLGAFVSVDSDASTVQISGGNLHSGVNIDCQNSGTTMRLLAGIAACISGNTTFTGDASLCKRPMREILLAIEDIGAKVTASERFHAPFTVSGIEYGTAANSAAEDIVIKIAGDISSQFISSLLIAAPLISDVYTANVKIIVTTKLLSKPYVLMTIDAMKHHGVLVEECCEKSDASSNALGDISYNSQDNTSDNEYDSTSNKEFFVSKGQRYKASDYHIQGDYSSAAFILAAGAISGKVTVTDLPEDENGDGAILQILEWFGARVTRCSSSKQSKCNASTTVTVEKRELHGIEVNLEDAPDLFPVVAVLGAVATGTTRIYGARHLAFKESNRIKTTCAFLSQMNADIEETVDGCTIHGGRPLVGARINTHGDHRIMFAAAIAGVVANGYTVIDDVTCANVSYPSFIRDLQALGGDIKYLRNEVEEEYDGDDGDDEGEDDE